MSVQPIESGPVAIHADPQTGAVTATTEGTLLAAPDPPTNDFLWKAVVVTCCLLLFEIGSALVVGLFVPQHGFVAVELLQGIFLVVFGFVGGLLAPSPVRK